MGWKPWIGIAIVAGAACGGCGEGEGAPDGSRTPTRPNLVLLISDDHDWEQLGFLGHPQRPTPSIDALASAGAVFPVAHATPRCRPSLAGLLSGRYGHQSGVYANASQLVLRSPNLLPRLLRKAGYLTYAEGKFWEGSPRDVGFSHGPDQERGDNGLRTDSFVRAGQADLFAFLEQAGDQPFFVWWAPMLPHQPHDPPAELLARFAPEDVVVPPWIDPADEADFRAAEARSLAMVAWLDRGVGELVDRLEQLGQLDHTLFLFLIDNGWANGHPAKGTPFEKGVRTPIVVRGPGVRPAVFADHLTTHLDVMPTLLDYAGVGVPEQCAGRSLRPLIEGREDSWRETLFGACYPPQVSEANRPEEDVIALWARDGRWKYVLWARDVDAGGAERLGMRHLFAEAPVRARRDEDLYDLDADPYERRNLAGDPAHRDELERLRGELALWWSSTGGRALPR